MAADWRLLHPWRDHRLAICEKRAPSDLGQFQDGIAPDSTTEGSAKALTLSADYPWTASEGYRTLAYWLIVFVGFAMYFAYFLVQAHWIFHMKGIGLSAAEAAWTMGLFTLSSVFGRLIGGWFQDIFPARFVFVVGLALMAIGIALGGLFSAGSVLLAYLASVILGFGFGSSVTNLPTILGNYFGRDAFSKLYGTAFMIALILASFAGILGGRLFDLFHSYYVAWEICIAISAAGIVALFFTVPRSQFVQLISSPRVAHILPGGPDWLFSNSGAFVRVATSAKRPQPERHSSPRTRLQSAFLWRMWGTHSQTLVPFPNPAPQRYN